MNFVKIEMVEGLEKNFLYFLFLEGNFKLI